MWWNDAKEQQQKTPTPFLDGTAPTVEFRVGGATLRNAVGIDINEIKALGRWTTNCYRRYIKPMSHEEVVGSLSILEMQSF
ncbi:hypothetical protein PSHT_05137 [Puccinia striiformis]|uniref:Uncharacterized protein n=1 Tax=Puccinia striiformis TaxID=27350 RepID=A0A2S4WB55_9BASI|nr:hypothetical protein PSHT_05137 [Puccinia striiformis]